jgi:hypothetical protein
MLVYANAFEAAPTVERTTVLAVVARWLTRKEAPRTKISDIEVANRIQYRSGARAEVVVSDESDRLYSLRYVHPDSDVVGREWFMEIGMVESPAHSLRMSVVLRTEEISSRVVRAIEPSRPNVIVELARSGLLSPSTPGLELLTLDDEYAAEGLRYSLAIADRKHPYIIVSPTSDGTYFVDPEIIRGVVVGLADVVRIPPGVDTYKISGVMGKDFATWHGAINVILPARQRPEILVPTVKFLPDALRDVESSGRRIETEILEAVTHRMNRPMFAQHISPGMVRDLKQRHELAKKKAEAEQRGDNREWAALLEQENTNLEREKGALAERLLEEQLGRDDDARRLEDLVDQLRFQNESLVSQMAALAAARSDGDESTLDDIRDAVFAAIDGSPTPEQSLLVVRKLFSDRVTVLPSAFRSAKQSKSFKYPARVLDLLRKLAIDYFGAIRSGGKGDAQAGQIFGDSYSARDSDTVENNKRARDLRRFDYEGVSVEMMGHLKIGVKPSASETIRIHFMWDAERERIVIGYCGPHLDHG